MFSLLKYLILGLLAIVALTVVLKVVGVVVGIGFALLITVGPILLVGYGVSRLLGHKKRVPEISEEDRRWLES